MKAQGEQVSRAGSGNIWDAHSPEQLVFVQQSYVAVMSETGMVAHTCNPNTQEAKTGRFLWVWDQLGLQSETLWPKVISGGKKHSGMLPERMAPICQLPQEGRVLQRWLDCPQLISWMCVFASASLAPHKELCEENISEGFKRRAQHYQTRMMLYGMTYLLRSNHRDSS